MMIIIIQSAFRALFDDPLCFVVMRVHTFIRELEVNDQRDDVFSVKVHSSYCKIISWSASHTNSHKSRFFLLHGALWILILCSRSVHVSIRKSCSATPRSLLKFLRLFILRVQRGVSVCVRAYSYYVRIGGGGGEKADDERVVDVFGWLRTAAASFVQRTRVIVHRSRRCKKRERKKEEKRWKSDRWMDGWMDWKDGRERERKKEKRDKRSRWRKDYYCTYFMLIHLPFISYSTWKKKETPVKIYTRHCYTTHASCRLQ